MREDAPRPLGTEPSEIVETDRVLDLMPPPALRSMPAEASHEELALVVLPLDCIVPVLALMVGALVELLPEEADGHPVIVPLVQEPAVVSLVAKRPEPVKTDFVLEPVLFFRRQVARELFVAQLLILVDFLDHRLEIKRQRPLHVRVEVPHFLNFFKMKMVKVPNRRTFSKRKWSIN